MLDDDNLELENLPQLQASPVLNAQLPLNGGVGGAFTRLFANLIVMGTGVVGRAFMEAYKQALANGGAAANKAGKAAAGRASVAEAEARQILNLKPKASDEEVKQAYDTLHAMNDPKKGGSEYIQAKITFARDALLREAPKEEGTKADKSEK